jgi:acetyl esterase/lipase
MRGVSWGQQAEPTRYRSDREFRTPPALVLLALSAGCAGRAETPAPGLCEVEVKRDVTYYRGEDADRVRHKLDVYLPKGKTDVPVVLFVHGGGWTFGDKSFFGTCEAVGKMFARHGVAAVVCNYRLSPGVRHPEHVKDVARAFAWARQNVKQYGGRPDQLFVSGHSAGGHLVALLATDESYLKAEGLSLKDVKGAMPISGVYGIPDNLFHEVFGKDAEVRKKAGPITHVKAECPPFLIVYAEKDYPFCDVASADFCRALVRKKVSAQALEIKGRNHIDVFTSTGRDDDPCARALLDFIAKHTRR